MATASEYRLPFEAPIFEQMPDTTDPSILKSVLRREIDIQVVSPLTGAPILDVEIKEIADIGILQLRKHARQQFARDIVRDILGSRKTGRAPR